MKGQTAFPKLLCTMIFKFQVVCSAEAGELEANISTISNLLVQEMLLL